MGVGQDHILSKGHLCTGSTKYTAGEAVVSSGDGTKIARATSAAAKLRGVVQENVDAAKVTTGKAVAGVAMLGIVRALAGAQVNVDDRVTNDTTARFVPVATSVGAKEFAGIALTGASGAGEYFDLLLVPAGSVNTAVS
jgi:hypothetical protein